MKASEPEFDISELLALVARHLDVRIPEIVREMRDLLASRITDLGGDPHLGERGRDRARCPHRHRSRRSRLYRRDAARSRPQGRA